MMTDDRKNFSQLARSNAIKLGQDKELFEKSKNVLLDLDTYDYPYLWSWLGLPIIQLPADIIATQEAIWKSKPDVIIETGVARGGSLIFYSSLIELIGGGKVIGVDVDIRKHNQESIEEHPLSKNIILVEGGSTEESTLKQIQKYVTKKSRVMVILDSDHSYSHVFKELELYAPLVTEGCYLVVADTLAGHWSEKEAPKNRSKFWFKGNEPLSAMNDFLSKNRDFQSDEALNGKLVLSSSPGGYLIKKMR